MSKYRFKTREEFERDGQWNDEYECPIDWNESGDMNHYLGQDVPEGANESCDLGEGFDDDNWYFQPTNYILKEEDYTGRWIKALVDNPNATGIKLGEVIQIIGKPAGYRLDKTSKGYSGMGVHCPLDTSKWELVEEPKQNYKVVPKYVKCIEVPEGWKLLKKGTIYKTDEYSGGAYRILFHEEGGGQITEGKEHCFVPATKQEFDAQFLNEQDPLYICKQEYRKGMRVISAAKAGIYSGEFIIDVDPKEFRNLLSNTDVVDYELSKGYLYFNGEYAEILEESDMLSLEIPPISELVSVTKLDMINYNSGIDEYLRDSGFKNTNPEAYNWLMKPSIESVQSVDVNLRTKKQINKFKF
jgi:hypothetical protein